MLQIRDYRDYGRNIIVIDSGDIVLNISHNGKETKVYVEKTIYEDSTYEEYIEIPRKYSERLISSVVELIKMGFDDVSTRINPIDIRYHRDFIELKYPVVRWMTQKQLKELREGSKKVIRYLKKRDSLIPLKSSYDYAEDFKVLKRSGDKRLVYYYYTEARTCEEDCPYVPKAIELIVYGNKTLNNPLSAKRFIMKVVKALIRPSISDAKKIDDAVSKLLGASKKKEVKLNVENSSINGKVLTVKIIEPGVSGFKKFYVKFLPVKIAGSKTNTVLVNSVAFEFSKPSKSDERSVFSLIRKYFKVKLKERTKNVEINTVVPMTVFIEFTSELTGIPKAQIKRRLSS